MVISSSMRFSHQSVSGVLEKYQKSGRPVVRRGGLQVAAHAIQSVGDGSGRCASSRGPVVRPPLTKAGYTNYYFIEQLKDLAVQPRFGSSVWETAWDSSTYCNQTRKPAQPRFSIDSVSAALPCPAPSGKLDILLRLTARNHHSASDYGVAMDGSSSEGVGGLIWQHPLVSQRLCASVL